MNTARKDSSSPEASNAPEETVSLVRRQPDASLVERGREPDDADGFPPEGKTAPTLTLDAAPSGSEPPLVAAVRAVTAAHPKKLAGNDGGDMAGVSFSRSKSTNASSPELASGSIDIETESLRAATPVSQLVLLSRDPFTRVAFVVLCIASFVASYFLAQ